MHYAYISDDQSLDQARWGGTGEWGLLCLASVSLNFYFLINL